MKQTNFPVSLQGSERTVNPILQHQAEFSRSHDTTFLLSSLTPTQRNSQTHQKKKNYQQNVFFFISVAHGSFIRLLRSNTKYFPIKLCSASHQKHIVLWWECKESLWHSQCISAPLIIISKLLNAAWNCWVVLYRDMLPFGHCLDSRCVCCLSVTHFARSDLSLLLTQQDVQQLL